LRELRRTAPNEPCTLNRWRREKPPARAARGIDLDRDALAALRATRVDHGAPAGRLHPHTESVRFLSMGDRGLERAFHGKNLF